jgi:hypothetical protein
MNDAFAAKADSLVDVDPLEAEVFLLACRDSALEHAASRNGHGRFAAMRAAFQQDRSDSWCVLLVALFSAAVKFDVLSRALGDTALYGGRRNSEPPELSTPYGDKVFAAWFPRISPADQFRPLATAAELFNLSMGESRCISAAVATNEYAAAKLLGTSTVGQVVVEPGLYERLPSFHLPICRRVDEASSVQVVSRDYEGDRLNLGSGANEVDAAGGAVLALQGAEGTRVRIDKANGDTHGQGQPARAKAAGKATRSRVVGADS